MANLVIRSRNEYFAPEKEKGGGNKIQGFPFFEKSFEQYCIENEMAILKFDLLMTVARMNEEADKFIEEYTKKYSGGGGGGGSEGKGKGTTESNNGTNTGVKGKTKEDQSEIKNSVESYYRRLIKFDENGKVYFDKSDIDYISFLIKNDPKSNFAKLFELSTQTKELYLVEGIPSADESGRRSWNYGLPDRYGNSYGRNWTLNDISEYDNWGNQVNGLFLASDPRNNNDIYWSNDGINHIYYNNDVGLNNKGGWLAHELYYHAFLHMIGKDWWHKRGMDIRNSIEFLNKKNR